MRATGWTSACLRALLAICALPAAQGWAAPGHLVTAALAIRILPPDVAAAVAQDLLASSAANESFTSCAVWCVAWPGLCGARSTDGIWAGATR